MPERNISLSPRKEDIRNKNSVVTPAVQFDLDQIKAHFYENLNDVRKQFDIADKLFSEGKTDEAQNIWRSQVVFVEGLMDFYLHEISKYALVKMFKGEWDKTDKYNNFMIPMSTVELGLRNPESTEWLFDRINTRFSREVYMSGEALRQQLSLIGMNYDDICKNAFPKEKGKNYISGNDRLKMIYQRRNQIAHQSDRIHETAEKEAIDKKTVESYINTIRLFVEEIHSNAAQKEQ